jgi:hypothetical protein
MFDGVVAGPEFYLTASAFMLSGLIWCRKRWDNRSRTPLPPGPPSLPLVGSILSLDDPLRPWLSFSAWRSTYGWHNMAEICSQWFIFFVFQVT